MEQVPGHFDYVAQPVPLNELRRTDERSRLGADDGAGESMAGDWMTGATEDRNGFWAVITAVGEESYYDGGVLYSFIEAGVTGDGTETFERLDMGRFGVQNAREWNDNTTVPDGAVVWMTHECETDLVTATSQTAAYRFAYRGGSPIAGETITYSNNTITGTVNLSSLTQTVTNNSSITVNAGKTFTFTGGGTYVYDAALFSITNNSSFTIQSGKTLTVAGPGSFYISAPLEVTSSSFYIRSPWRFEWVGITFANGNNTLDFAGITKALVAITGPSAAWAINAITGAFVDGFRFTIVNLSGQLGRITGSSFYLPGGYDFYIPDGASVNLVYRSSSSKLAIDATSTMYGITASDLSHNKSSDIASSGTTDLTTATGDYAHVTGTTTITALGTATSGVVRDIIFDGALTLTHNATSLILPTGANITTAAGDAARFRSEGSGNWRCIFYQRKDGTALASSGGGLTVGTTTIASGTSGRLLYDNAGVLGETTPGAVAGTLIPYGGTLTATGSVQGDAAAITTNAVLVTGADGTKGVILPDAHEIRCYNTDNAVLKVYPPSGHEIDSLGADNSYGQSSNRFVTFVRSGATAWTSVVGSTVS